MRQTAAIGVAAVWLSTVIVLSVRLIGGRIVIARLRSAALPCGESSNRLLEESRRSLGLSRPVALGVHAGVGSPVAIGGWRPLIVVPLDWEGWSEPQRRACLLHELTHLARRDDWVKIVQEIIRVPFFFHPLVRWLLNRLDRERELFCDESVVALGVDPIGYARLLLDMARRPGRLLPTSLGPRPAWLPFFDGRTVTLRIERLLEDDMMRPLAPLPFPRLFGFGAIAFAAAIGVGGLRVRAVEPRAKQDKPPAAQAAPVQTGARKIEGVILDPDGKAAADVVVVAGFLDAGKPNHQVFKTNKYGRFTWWVPESPVMAYFVAHKEGLAPVIWTKLMSTKVNGAEAERTLARAESFSATLIDDVGRPIVGARVRIEVFASGSTSAPDKSGNQTTSGGYAYVYREVVGGSPIEKLFEATTDSDGAFTLHATRPHAWLKLAVTAWDGSDLRVRAEKKSDGLLETWMADSGFVAAPLGQASRLVTSPAARIAGRVVSKIPGLSVAGLKVMFQASTPPGTRHRNANQGVSKVATDDTGRFVFDKLNEETVNVFLIGPGEGDRWTSRAAQDVALKSGVTSEVTIELIPGVEVSGKVVIQGAGTPVEEAAIGAYGPARPRTGAAISRATSDPQGRFRLRLPPGETYLYVMGSASSFVTLPNDGSSRTFTVPEGVDAFEAPTLEVRSAVVLHGRVVDATGEPVPRATLVGVGENVHFILSKTFTPAGVTNDRGEFRLSVQNHSSPPGEATIILVRVRDGREFSVPITPAADGEVTVKLPIEQ